MDYSTGGRGNQAPYDTTHVRIPVPIKELVQAASKYYRETLFLPTLNVVTPLATGDDDNQEDDNRSDPSDLETIQSQAQMIQSYASEIHYLKHKIDELNSLTSLEEAKESARSILRGKKSASKSIAKLLTGIYQTEVIEKDLISPKEE
jgi:hypothetical protein